MNAGLLEKLKEKCKDQFNVTIWSHEFADFNCESEQSFITEMERLKGLGQVDYSIQIQNGGRSRLFAGVRIL
jgi:hypothetical protein